VIKNIESYKKDFAKVLKLGSDLEMSIQYECYPSRVKDYAEKTYKENAHGFLEELPDFKTEYQLWYSESLVLIKQLLPDRLSDFIGYYEKPKTRKNLLYGNYKIEDYLQGTSVTTVFDGKEVVGPSAAIPQFNQQVAILKSISKRFESSLFEITQLVQADLFDDEISSARELLKHKFIRAAGAIAGVVLEKHLGNICSSHNIKVAKKTPTIADYNDVLKKEGVIRFSDWRFIQFLGDIRNTCDHNKNKEPTIDDVNTLIVGVDKIMKTIF
jgi:hypothetical protein